MTIWRRGFLLVMILGLVWPESFLGQGILAGFFWIIFFISSFILSRRRKESRRDEKIEFDWEKDAIFVHAAEAMTRRLKGLLKEKAPGEIECRMSKLGNGLYIYFLEEPTQASLDWLRQFRRELEEKLELYVEEVPYKKIMEEEQISDEELIGLLGEGPFEVNLRAFDLWHH
jgi:hypothetical protein